MRPPSSDTPGIRPRVQLAKDTLRPTRAEVDLDVIVHNHQVVRRTVAGARVLAVVKADAYGHGVVPVARRLQEDAVDGFGVALAEEGLELREAGITTRILVLNGVYGGAHGAVLDAGLTPVVYDLPTIDAFARARPGAAFDVHLKVDTGMARLGVPLDELDTFLSGLRRYPSARIEGLMTHLASADCDPDKTKEQLEGFARARTIVSAHGHRPRILHVANSAGALLHPDSRFQMVRAGLALYGYGPREGAFSELRPAMRLRTEIIALRQLSPGQTVGYEGSFRAERPMRIATVPVGYGDGLMRRTSNRGEMLVAGERCPIVGHVSMDLTTLDITRVPGADIGAEVVVVGQQGHGRVTADDLAKAAGTIPYEVLTNISRRVPRFYP